VISQRLFQAPGPGRVEQQILPTKAAVVGPIVRGSLRYKASLYKGCSFPRVLNVVCIVFSFLSLSFFSVVVAILHGG